MNQYQKKIDELLEKKWSIQEIADYFGISYNASKKRIQRVKKQLNKCEDKDKLNESFTTDFKEDTATIQSKSINLKTVDDVLKHAEIDTSVWEVDRIKTNYWNMPIKDKKVDLKWDQGKTTGTVKDNGTQIKTMFQITVYLKKKEIDKLEEALKSVTKELYTNPNTFLPEIDYKNPYEPSYNMMEISLIDHHFGKLCLNGEGTKESEEYYLKAVDNLIEKSKNFTISLIVVPIGSDFFNIDSMENTTTKGTKQDTDKLFFDIYKKGCKSIIKAIYKLREIAPVQILWVPGNHDFVTSFFICEHIKAFFHNDDYVNVNTRKETRKYITYGKTLIGYTHGSEEKNETLSRLILSENLYRKDINEIKYFEFHIGHKHRRKSTTYVTSEEVGNVFIKELPSLCGTDYWHYKKGFVDAQRAAKAFIYHWNYGCLNSITCDHREIT